jgi:hypothetical protein
MGLPRGSVKQGRGGAVQRVAEGKNPGLMLAAAVCGCGGVLTIGHRASAAAAPFFCFIFITVVNTSFIS